MSYLLKISKQDIFPHNFNNDIQFKSKNYTKTFFENYLFIFESLETNEKVSIKTKLNKLPLFWQNQNDQFPNEYHLNLEALNFIKPGFGLIVLEEIENLDANYLFCLELSLFKFLFHKEMINPFANHFTSTHQVKSSTLMNASNIDLTLKNSFIKLKIGINNLDSEKEVIATLSKNNILRLDANQNLTIEQLEYLLKDIPAQAIDCIEEPFENIQDWHNFSLKEKYKLAIDESINMDLKSLISYIKYYVVKPTYNYSISSIFKYYFAPDKNKKLILSSSYEEAESLNFLIYLASLIDPLGENNHGLGTVKVMGQESLFETKFLDGEIIIQSFPIS